MANITKQGTGGAVKVANVGGAFETSAELRSWSVDESVDTVEEHTKPGRHQQMYTLHMTMTRLQQR